MLEIKVPSPGESITEVEIGNWLVSDGDIVTKDQELCEIDSDKATLTIAAEDSGQVSIKVSSGEVVSVNSVIGLIDTSKSISEPNIVESKKENIIATENLPVVQTDTKSNIASPAAKKIDRELNIEKVTGTGKAGRVTKQDVLRAKVAMGTGSGKRTFTRTKMSSLRRKLSKRLVSVKNETAMLTTFNEVDMSEINSVRKRYKEKFYDKYGIKLGFMSFFTKAVDRALQLYPKVNSMIDGDELVQFDYQDISIAVSTDRGLMVPVLRNVENLDFFGVEKEIVRLADKARNGKLSIDDMLGGTFTITNGGVFGSMLSTPILNPPQSAILGMHNIVQRPVALEGKVLIRPIMYLALSYDHRVIDGKESVGFLVAIKEALEDPVKLLFDGDVNKALFKKSKKPLSYRPNYKYKL